MVISHIKHKIDSITFSSDLVNAVFFGVLSILFGVVKIQMPAFEGITADFREIPLLIAVFYLRSFWWLFLVCGITILTPSSVSGITVYWMHFFAMLFAWFSYHKIIKPVAIDWKRALAWILVSSCYYLLFIIPLLLIFNQWLEPKYDFLFLESYYKMLQLIKYEYVVTVLVTSMYLVQLDIRRQLIEHELKLEEQVRDRTQKLASANEKLQNMNENLDELAIQRSQQIEEQLRTLNKYAHMNSHELRAPLSNILGLVSLLKKKADREDREQLIHDLDLSATQLDDIIKQMNDLLEREMKLPGRK